MNFDFSNMGDNISRLRRRIGMTQEMLAYRLGVSAQAVSKWERQLSCPDVSLLPVMAEIFGVSIDELFIRCTAEESPEYIDSLPWEDDGEVRVALFEGRRLCASEVHTLLRGEDTVLIIHHDPNGRRKSKVLEKQIKSRAKTPPE